MQIGKMAGILSSGGGAAVPSTPLEYIGKSAMTASATSIDVAVPSGYAENDLLILLVEADSNTNGINTPSGWTLIETGVINWTSAAAFYKIAGASENSVSVPNPKDSVRGMMLCWRGVDTSDPIDSSRESAQWDSSLTFINADTLVDNCMVVLFVAMHMNVGDDTDNLSSWANTSLESIIEGHDEHDAVAYGGGIAFAYGIKAVAGAINNTTITADKDSAFCGISFAIAPAL